MDLNRLMLVSPLKAACLEGNFTKAVLYLENGANPNLECPLDWSTVHLTIDKGNLDFLKILVQYHADLNLPGGSLGDTPLMVAVERGDLSIIRYLLTFPLNLDFPDNEGKTALTIAVHRNDLEVSRLLIRAGANPNHQDFKGKTPLMYAAEQDDSLMLDMLIANNASTKIRCHKGRTALHRACFRRAISAVKTLLLRDSDVYALDNNNQSPWAIAKTSYDPELEVLFSKL